MTTPSWWRRVDHFDWLTLYLAPRGITKPIRAVMGVLALSIVLVPIEATMVPADRRGPLVMTLYWSLGIAGVGAGYLWLTRWPTRRQSVVLALTGTLTMASWAVLQADPALALLACCSLVISGGYFALFHSPRYVLFNVLVAGLADGHASWRWWVTDGPVHAALSFWLVLALNIVGPLAVLVLINAFGLDLPHADRDALTGLLNRRGLRTHSAALIEAAHSDAYLRVVLIDLDDFKRVNDTYGHRVGDDVLRSVAAIVRSTAGDDSVVVSRVGGEEILIVDAAPTIACPRYADHIRTQIEHMPIGITASIGSAGIRLAGIDVRQIDRIIDVADQAMYKAKRLGGNQIRHVAIAPPADGGHL